MSGLDVDPAALLTNLIIPTRMIEEINLGYANGHLALTLNPNIGLRGDAYGSNVAGYNVAWLRKITGIDNIDYENRQNIFTVRNQILENLQHVDQIYNLNNII